MSLRRKFRGWVVLWALLQLALPTAATYADAVLEGASAETVFAHVESNTGATCQPVHAADCALCHLVESRVAPSDAPSCIPEFAAQRALPPESRSIAPVGAEGGGSPLPRAPPVA